MEFSVEHIGLPAREPKLLAEWYEKTLGAERVFENPPAYYLRLSGGLILEIYQSTSHIDSTQDNGLAGWRHLALKVASLEKAQVELAERGCATQEMIKPAGGGGRVLFYKDPEGNLFHLVERDSSSLFMG